MAILELGIGNCELVIANCELRIGDWLFWILDFELGIDDSHTTAEN